MGMITVIGVGYTKQQLTIGAADMLKSGKKIILHTQRCGAAEWLAENGIAFSSLDLLYDEYEDFDEHTEAVVEAVNNAAEDGDILYCVMDIRDKSAVMLAEQGAFILPGPSCEGGLMAYAAEGVQLYAASDWENMHPDAGLCAIVREIDNKELACEVKLKLMEVYPDDAEIVMHAAGEIKKARLYDLDRVSGYDHRFSVLVKAEKDLEKLNDLSFRNLVDASRTNDALYKEWDAAAMADAMAKIAGATAYAEDRGEFTAADIMVDARDVIIG